MLKHQSALTSPFNFLVSVQIVVVAPLLVIKPAFRLSCYFATPHPTPTPLESSK